MISKLGLAKTAITRITVARNYRVLTRKPLDVSNLTSNHENSKEKEQRRYFKNFGHKPPKDNRVTKLWHAFLCITMFLTVLDYNRIGKWLFPPVDAASLEKNSECKDKDENEENISDLENSNDSSNSEYESESESETEKNSGEEVAPKKKKPKLGFRDRKIIEYENRMRAYSTPDKIFRYFATIRLSQENGAEVYMTPDDFLRAITPGMKQPDGLGLDQFKKYDPKDTKVNLDLSLEEDSIFYKLGSAGLITFSDYIFLLTVLSTSRRHFEIAFRMFDINGDGDVDSDEFVRVATLVRNQTSIGNRHRDHANTGNTFKGVNSALTTYFFGKNLDQKLTIEKFLNFQRDLQKEILYLEFLRKEPENGKITELDFAELLLAFAGYTEKKKARMLKRVKKTFQNEDNIGISKQEFMDFFHFLNNINDVDTALTFYHIAGASIDQATLKHVAKTVAKIDLSDHIIRVVFTIFDENCDNQLSNREFVSVMKNRLLRGLEKPKDTGFLKLLYSILKCAKEKQRGRRRASPQVQIFKFSDNVRKNYVKQAYLHVYIKPGSWSSEELYSQSAVNLEVSKVVKTAKRKEGAGGGGARHVVFNNTVIVPTGEGRWYKVNVTSVVDEWFRFPRNNLGLEVRGLDRKGKHAVVLDHEVEDGSMVPYIEVHTEDARHSRFKRQISNNCNEDSDNTLCCRYPLVVDFEEFGWDWVIAPKRYEANYCNGECPYVFLQTYPHTHIVHLARPPGSPGPCCAPRKMSPISMLYFDADLNIVYETLPGMVVDRCGCS